MKAFILAWEKCPRKLLFLCGLCALVFSGCKPSQAQIEELIQKGVRDWQAGARQVALQEFSKAIELDPKSADAYMTRGAARFELKDFPGAISDCNAVIALEPRTEKAYLIKGASKFYLKDYAGAKNDLGTAISLSSEDYLAFQCRGLVQAQMRDWDGAQTDLTVSIKLNPDNAEAYRNRGAIEMMLKDYEKGIADASDSIDLDSVNAADAYRLRAIGESNLKNRTNSFADANQAIELIPSEPKAYLTRAMVGILWDDYSGASNDLQTAFQLSPTNTEVFLYRGLLDEKCGRYHDAAAELNQGLTNYLDNLHAPEIYEALGFVEENLYQWNSALETFHKGLKFNSPPDDIHGEVFLLKCRLGHTNEAQTELTAYIHSIPAAKSGEWKTIAAQFLAGKLTEAQLIEQATTSAKRPTDIPKHLCEAYYYAAMKCLLAGDTAGAVTRFQKSMGTTEDNSYQYLNARTELQALK
jgi:tetratricopeptide (TPR) repeat protein